jgi:hypothetical protein
MKEPRWETVDEEEFWKFVAWHLMSRGIDSVLVGGAVVSIYSRGAYRSGDIDLVEPLLAKESEIKSLMESLGFQRINRHYVHPRCQHLFIEFVSAPVSIGDDYRIIPDEKFVEGKSLKLLSPTDCIKDRLASYIHFNARECMDQALLVAKNQPFSLDKVKIWCENESGNAKQAFIEFKRRFENRDSV